MKGVLGSSTSFVSGDDVSRPSAPAQLRRADALRMDPGCSALGGIPKPVYMR